MDTVVKIVGIIGGIITVLGLIGVLLGLNTWRGGMKNGDGAATDRGISEMVVGGITAGIAGGVTAAVVAAINAIHW
jgi:hypothetical protein